MDSLLVFPPGASMLASAWASAIQLGSWLDAQTGADYGAAGLIQSVQAQNALRDGGVFAYRRGMIRHMAIPLIVNTPSPVMWEAALARAVNPGAILAVQPEGVPSSQAVYFDIIDGRWEPAYNTFHNRAGVRKGTLHLDTQPWGYWPTEILLASAASIGWAGHLAVNGASVIGDVAPLAHILLAPTVASTYTASGADSFQNGYGVDFAAISLGAAPSFSPLFLPNFNSLTNGGAASLVGDKYAPGSQAVIFTFSPAAGSPFDWSHGFAYAAVGTTLEPAYRGRFRAFAFVKAIASRAPFALMMDAVNNVQLQALATGNQLATGYAMIPSGINNQAQFFTPTTYSPSPAFITLDMGELTLPPAGASGVMQSVSLRLWFGLPSTAATTQVSLGGFYLLPVDGAAGLVTRGLVVPSTTSVQGWGAMQQGSAEFNALYAEGAVRANGLAGVVADLRAAYRGVAPRIGASTTQLLLLTADRPANSLSGTYPVMAQANLEWAQVSVSYRPQFQFLAPGG